MNEFHENLWAPWRMDFIQGLAGVEGSGCFLCDYAGQPSADTANHVVMRTPEALVCLNRFPYTNGHLLIAPTRHVAELDDLAAAEFSEFWRQTRDAKRLLQHALAPQGFNLGMNFGRCAGAGLPDHLHAHIVPRWNGDTNYMAVTADVRVIPQALERLADQLRRAASELHLPAHGGEPSS